MKTEPTITVVDRDEFDLDAMDSGVFVLTVDRSEVESRDISSVLKVLQGITATKQRVEKFCESVDLTFSGYDTDPRATYQIPEIMQFVRRINEKWNYWFYFFPKGTLKAILRCLSDPLNRSVLKRVIENNYIAFDAIFKKYQLTDDRKRRMATEIAELLAYKATTDIRDTGCEAILVTGKKRLKETTMPSGNKWQQADNGFYYLMIGDEIAMWALEVSFGEYYWIFFGDRPSPDDCDAALDLLIHQKIPDHFAFRLKETDI